MSQQRPFLRNLAFVSVVAVSLAAVVVLGMTRFGEQMNQHATSWFFGLRDVETTGTEDIVVVAIDNPTIAKFGFPVDRAYIARGLRSICAAGPSVIAVDLLFSDSSNPASDQMLAAALADCPQAVLASKLADENVTTLEAGSWADPLPDFALRAAGIAHAHADPDLDGVSRRVLLAKAADGRRRWALGLEAYRVHVRHKGAIVEDDASLIVGQRIIPAPVDRAAAGHAGVNEGARSQRSMIINYAGPEGTFKRVSMVSLQASASREEFAGKAVLIGVTAADSGIADRKFTPFSNAGQDMSGVEIHANVLRTILTGEFLQPMRNDTALAAMAAIATVVALLLLLLRGVWLAMALVAVGIVVHLAPFAIFLREQMVAPTFSLAAAFWAPVIVGGSFQYAAVWRYYVAADASRRRLRGRLEMVSHEMRSPLTAIQGSSEVMARYELNDERRKQLTDLIHRESKRLSGMVERFLDVERLEAGEMELRKESVALPMIVDQTLERIDALAKRKNITVQASVNSDPRTEGDPELLEFALYNLLNNAVKYSPEGSTVEVSVRANSALGIAMLDVKDQGAGIATDEQSKIFDRFYRTEDATKSGQPGLGLGLSIVREIARHHGGSVQVQSRPGQGATFSLVLPLVKAHGAA